MAQHQQQARQKSEVPRKVESERYHFTAVETRKLQLREKHLELYQSVSQSMQDELRELYREELKAEVWENADEVRKEMREQLAQELTPEVKEDLLKKYRMEVRSNFPDVYREEIEEYKAGVKASIAKDYVPLLKAEIKERNETVFMEELKAQVEEQYTVVYVKELTQKLKTAVKSRLLKGKKAKRIEATLEVLEEQKAASQASVEQKTLQQSLRRKDPNDEKLFGAQSDFSDLERVDWNVEGEVPVRQRPSTKRSSPTGTQDDDNKSRREKRTCLFAFGPGANGLRAEVNGQGEEAAVSGISEESPAKSTSDLEQPLILPGASNKQAVSHRDRKRGRFDLYNGTDEDGDSESRSSKRSRSAVDSDASGDGIKAKGKQLSEDNKGVRQDDSGDEAGDDQSVGKYADFKIFDENADMGNESGRDDHKPAEGVLADKFWVTFDSPPPDDLVLESKQGYIKAGEADGEFGATASQSSLPSRAEDCPGSSQDNAIDLDSDSDEDIQLASTSQNRHYFADNHHQSYAPATNTDESAQKANGNKFPDLPDYDSDPEAMQEACARYDENIVLALVAAASDQTQSLAQSSGEEYEDEETLFGDVVAVTSVVKDDNEEAVHDDDCAITSWTTREVVKNDPDPSTVVMISVEEDLEDEETLVKDARATGEIPGFKVSEEEKAFWNSPLSTARVHR